MPQKCKFSKSEIAEAGILIVKKQGYENVSARKVGEILNSSSKVIFSVFKNMEELKKEILLQASNIYNAFCEKETQNSVYPPYKAMGMAYISFAEHEKNIFKFLFMRDRTNEPAEKSDISKQIEIIQKNTGLSFEKAYLFHLEMWVYVHGIATMIATNYLNWDTNKISEMLTDIYHGLKHRFLNNSKE